MLSRRPLLLPAGVRSAPSNGSRGRGEGIGVGLAHIFFSQGPFSRAERVILSLVCPRSPIQTWRVREVDFSLSCPSLKPQIHIEVETWTPVLPLNPDVAAWSYMLTLRPQNRNDIKTKAEGPPQETFEFQTALCPDFFRLFEE